MFYLPLRNHLHFGQAQGTPFTVSPLSDSINWATSTKTTNLVLDGTYINSELDDIQQLLL
jgi:hypothetical protein